MCIMGATQLMEAVYDSSSMECQVASCCPDIRGGFDADVEEHVHLHKVHVDDAA